MDVESPSIPLASKPCRSCAPARCRTACVVVVCIIMIVLNILGLAKHPTTTVNSITLHSIDFSLITLKLGLILTIDNPNRVSLKCHDRMTLLNFEDHLARSRSPLDTSGSQGSETLNLTLTVFADRLLTNNQAFRDVAQGSLPLNPYTGISGKVRIPHFIKFHVVSTSPAISTCTSKMARPGRKSAATEPSCRV